MSELARLRQRAERAGIDDWDFATADELKRALQGPVKRGNRLLTIDDLRQMPRPKPLIKGVLYSDMEHNLFGPQGCSKTFLVIDWALHMAHRRRWMGKPTRHAKTLIICGEGGGRVLADRIDAWLAHHEIGDDSAVRESVRVTEFPVHMLDAAQVDELLELVTAANGFDLIAIDTLMANFGAGDENAQADMVAFCDAMRRVRLSTGSGVLVVHHTGHADRTRPQGGNALRRNVDIELRVDRDGEDGTLYGVMGGGELKSRHGAGIGLIPYRLETVDTGQTDEDGESVTSCVILATQDTPHFEGAKASNQGLGKNQQAAVTLLRKIADSTGQDVGDPEGIYIATAEFYSECKAAGLSRQRAYSIRKSFANRGWIMEAVGGFRWMPINP